MADFTVSATFITPLVNADNSALTATELEQLDAFLDREGSVVFVGDDDDAFQHFFCDIMGEDTLGRPAYFDRMC